METEKTTEAATKNKSFFKAWMVLLILPMIGIVGMVLMLSSDDENAPATDNRISDRATPAPQTFVPPTLAATTPLPSIVNQPAPSIELTTLGGQVFTLQDYRGKRVVINFWASWCTPCVEEMPALQAFSEAQGENGVQVLAVTDPDNGQTLDAVKIFLDEYELKLPVGLDTDFALHFAMGVSFLPLTYLIDEEGVVRAYLIGQLTEERLQEETSRVFDTPS